MSQDQGATVQVLLAKQGEFRAFLARKLQDDATADDILQEVLLRCLPKLHTLRDEHAAISWFYGALRNAVIDHYRRRGSKERTLKAFADEVSEAPTEETDAAVCRCVLSLAESLKAEYADALQHTTIGDVPIAAYAEQAGISNNHASVRAYRAKAALKKRVVATCGACASGGCGTCTCGEPA